MYYRFLKDVWYDKHDGTPNEIHNAGDVTALDWPQKDIDSALVTGLIEKVEKAQSKSKS